MVLLSEIAELPFAVCRFSRRYKERRQLSTDRRLQLLEDLECTFAIILRLP